MWIISINKKIKIMRFNKLFSIAVLFSTAVTGSFLAQDKKKTDTTSVEVGKTTNVMLSASDNIGPRNVNIGLPAQVGGISILENGLPVVYFFWPEFPTKAWRMDATINRVQVLDLGLSAIKTGEVGVSLGTWDNLGTDKFQVKGSLNSNHFGLLKGDINFSGPLNNSGLKYTLGAYGNFDPGTFDTKGLPKYFNDRTQLYKAGLTQDYDLEGLKGSFSILYKYINFNNTSGSYAPFIWKKGGKVEELKDFKMGSKSYYQNTGKITLQDAFTGEFVERDIARDFGSESHTIDFISDNKLDNGLNLKFVGRYHRALTGVYAAFMTGFGKSNDNTKYYETEGGAEYKGDVQNVLSLASKRTPIRSFTSTLEVGRKTDNHDWSVGLNQWTYQINKFASEGVIYYQTVESDPKKLIRKDLNAATNNWENKTNDYLNQYQGFEYHNGNENKTALFFTDKWKTSDELELNFGARLELHTLNGDYQDRDAVDPNTGGKYTHLWGPKVSINKIFWNKAFMLSGIYKMPGNWGFLAEANYNEQGGHVESYTIGVDPKLKQSHIPAAGFGIFYNYINRGASFLPSLSLVSKATYLQKDEYRTTVNFAHPSGKADVKRESTSYDIQTIGWTTDIVASVVKNFDLHLLLTVQAPKYKNYSGVVNWVDKSGNALEDTAYNFSDYYVTGISKTLIEIDPSYTYKDFRIWASARYFSKQYINKPNTLELEGRWETFAGVNYKINKNLDLGVNVVNLLNDRGASGSMPDGDLVLTKEKADAKDGTLMSGSYIRPFTVEFGLKFNF